METKATVAAVETAAAAVAVAVVEMEEAMVVAADLQTVVLTRTCPTTVDRRPKKATRIPALPIT